MKTFLSAPIYSHKVRDGTYSIWSLRVSRFAGSACGVVRRLLACSNRPALLLGVFCLGALSIGAQTVLPEVIDFEAAEGFTIQRLSVRSDWKVRQGSAEITKRDSFSGFQSLVLTSATPSTVASHLNAAFTGHEVVFVDFYTKPSIADERSPSALVDVNGSSVGFVRLGQRGQVYAFDGRGNGTGDWVSADTSVAVDSEGISLAWLRLTLRQDFRSKSWDLYLNGILVKTDLGFADNSVTSFSGFDLMGSSGGDSFFDALYAGDENPLFVDQDRDGMDDAWELANGLNPAVNDRNRGKPSAISRFQQSTRPVTAKARLAPAVPSIAAAAAADPSTFSGLRLFLKANVGVTVDANSKVSTWADQSGLGKDATQSTAANRPPLVTNQINGLPVLRFTSTSSQFLSLSNVMTGATEGDAFVVLKSTVNGSTFGVWNWNAAGAGYPLADGRIQDGFAASSYYTLGKSSQNLTQYHIYNVSGKAGDWIARINGQTVFRSTANGTPTFSSTTKIGTGGYDYLTGDVAEVVVYGRVLTASERESVGSYLAQKYALFAAPATPTALSASQVSNTQISLIWTGSATLEAKQYDIERQTGGGGYVVVATVAGTSYIDGSVASGVTYDYRVTARNYAGSSAPSAPITVSAPTNLPTVFPAGGMRLWLKADDGSAAGLVPWLGDQSGNGNDAVQTAPTQGPTLVNGQINGRPVLRFVTANKKFLTLPNFMGSAVAGDIFAVLKTVENAPAGNKGLWRFGPISGGNFYPLAGGNFSEDFGSTLQRLSGTPAYNLTTFNIYNVTAQSGRWTTRFSGVLQSDMLSNTVGFRTDPVLGWNTTNPAWDYFDGDIAELIAFNRVLTNEERDTVGRYLQSKYALSNISAPATPTGLAVVALSSTQASITWTDANPQGMIYTVERQAGTGAFVFVADVEGGLGFVDTGLQPASSYSYRIKSRNYTGVSPASAGPVSITTPASVADMPMTGMRLWLRADAAVVNRAGAVTAWMDQSGLGNHATQSVVAQQPSLVSNVVNGRPAVRFAASTKKFLSLPTFMAGASAGEIFAVLKATASAPAGNKGLWRFGPINGGNFYPLAGGNLSEDFGSTTQRLIGKPLSSIAAFNAYGISAQTGSWVAYMNGLTQFRANSNVVGFSTNPTLGWNTTNTAWDYFDGDIAEIIVYDRTLSDTERENVGNYLNRKYAFVADQNYGNFRDTNGDGLSDNSDRQLGYDPYNLDLDGDGTTNAQEIMRGTDPFKSDTDGDGVNDTTDAFPLDPTRWNPLSPSGGDVTPPTIALSRPIGAVLIP